VARAGLVGITVLAGVAAVPAVAVSPTVVRDRAGDAVDRGLDLTRAQLGVAADGRLRVVLTLRRDFTPRSLLASSGPPGSLCLRLWTTTAPGAAMPDHLLCVSGERGAAAFRATIASERAGLPPRRVTAAEVTRPSDRSVAVRFPRTVIGAPALVRWAAEATTPGCARISCVDLAPDAPRTSTLRLR
jgi:hypothetical protein